MHIHHVAVWTKDLEVMKEFYSRVFQGKASDKYVIRSNSLNLILSNMIPLIDLLTHELRNQGYSIVGEPRLTGDGTMRVSFWIRKETGWK
ncbi:VOC family protein [Paenibacillus larvae]|nr:VOC family protein [Paenibacillus larvae]MCY9509949.1 VOC family protein [Paenibacillus larvae]MCY9524798.1 VOC family protein [Paenibacillus larvae]